mmetsp:Transcript_98591/g.211324  ORF Transcript_98591/g.211324 Transcript_98591/m.211324 type:complete len:148 (+) Transcript_98591:88-531(+)
MSIRCCAPDFGTTIQGCRRGPALWMVGVLSYNLPTYGVYIPLALVCLAFSLILVIVGSAESDYIIGKKVAPIKAALDGSCCCGFVMQTFMSLLLSYCALIGSQGYIGSLYAGVAYSLCVVEVLNLTGFSILFCMRMFSKDNKETKKD